MSFEFEALVGHLYIVGGRAISAAPPGSLVEIAPHKAARGREADTFFALVMPSGQAVAPAKFFEQMAQLAAERYFNSTGSVTSGLRDVFTTLNQNLHEHNQRSPESPYEANLLCAVLRGSDLIVGRVGPAVVVINHQGQTRTFPEDLTVDEALYTAPLGIHPIPNVRMSQYRVGSGTRMIMGDANIADFAIDHITGSLMAQDLSMTLVAFKELAKLQLTLLAVQFVPPDDPVAKPLPAGQSTKEVEAALRAAKKPETAPDGTPVSAVEARAERKKNKSAEKIQQQARRGLSLSAFGLAGIFRLLNRILDRFFPPPKENERNVLSSPLAAGAIILVPLAVVFLVIGLWLSGAGNTGVEICVGEAVARAETARSIPPSEIQTGLAAWDQVLIQVDSCRDLRPDDPTLNALQREAQNYIDGTNQIKRRELTVIDTFTAASLTRIIAQGQDLYVLDSANGVIYRLSLNPDGLSVSGGISPPVTQSGLTIGGRVIGEFIDIAFANGRLIALDRNGVLVTCSPIFVNECESTQLSDADTWENPIAMQIWNSNVYVLDNRSGASVIWRYSPSGNVYGGAIDYFDNQRVITNAVDFIIDNSGWVTVLLADGTVNRYLSGQAQPFEFISFPGPRLSNGTSMYYDSFATGQRLYFVDQVQRTIFETSPSGTHFSTYRTFNEDNFALIEDVTTTSDSNFIYVVSGNTVFALSR
ncbi:MAG: hypothetical protein RLP44_08890 [Aggregatilineales bacterium]